MHEKLGTSNSIGIISPGITTQQRIPDNAGANGINKVPGARIFNTNNFILSYEGRGKKNKKKTE